MTRRVDAIDFIDSRTGWVGGPGLLLRTTDGGATWSTLLDVADPEAAGWFATRELAFADAVRGVALGEVFRDFAPGVEPPLPRLDPACVYTADGGRTWTPCETSPPDHLLDICWTSPTSSVALAEGRQPYVSEGEGRPWVEQTMELAPPYDAKLACTHNADVWVVGGMSPSLASVPAFRRSVDGGRTWSDATGTARGDLDLWMTFESVAASGAGTAWVAGGRGNDGLPSPRPWLIHTSDGGASWVRPDLSFAGLGALDDVDFADDDTGIAVGFRGTFEEMSGGLIIYTTDGGATWSRAEVPEEIQRVTDVITLR